MRWLGLERLSRLRGDAHAPNDCLHFGTGTGVNSAWTEMLFHQIMTEDAESSSSSLVSPAS